MRFHKIQLSGFLSFGWEPTEIGLRPLNVLIGPNGSGKSNLIAAVGVLKALPTDIAGELRLLGSVDVIHKGAVHDRAAALSVEMEDASGRFVYDLSLQEESRGGLNRVAFSSESIKKIANDRAITLVERTRDHVTVSNTEGGLPSASITHFGIDPSKSLMQEHQFNHSSPVPTSLAAPMIYRDWTFGGGHHARRFQPADLPTDVLMEDASNLALVLNELSFHSDAMSRVEVAMKAFYPGFGGIKTRVVANGIQLFLQEGSPPVGIPATRLSDGTLRFLALLAVLCHHTPPPLVCIEEPELGLHPDLIPTVADLLRDASTRTQLIVTTHSDALVDCFTRSPEDVLVCERDEKGTHVERLDPERLKSWLERYRLGTLWRRGDIGGNRW